MVRNIDGQVYDFSPKLTTRDEFIKEYIETREKEGWLPITYTGCTDIGGCECCRIKTYLENRAQAGQPICTSGFPSGCSCECCRTLYSEPLPVNQTD